MIKTQIQVPEKQYQALREFAREREWSMAETFRRGAELLLEMYPHGTGQKARDWVPPGSGKVGWKGLDAASLKKVLENEGEPVLPSADRITPRRLCIGRVGKYGGGASRAGIFPRLSIDKSSEPGAGCAASTSFPAAGATPFAPSTLPALPTPWSI